MVLRSVRAGKDILLKRGSSVRYYHLDGIWKWLLFSSYFKSIDWFISTLMGKVPEVRTNSIFKTSNELTVERYKTFQNIWKNIDNYIFWINIYIINWWNYLASLEERELEIAHYSVRQAVSENVMNENVNMHNFHRK